MSETIIEKELEPVGTLYYFGDPMCSWCWGFRPVLEQVDLEYPELKRVTVMGGLRGGEEVPMGDDLAEMIRNAWYRIEQSTGQKFNHDLWQEHRPLATTWPACRAVLAARLLDAKGEWPFMVGMFKAYFTEALDPSRQETHLKVAEARGLDLDAFSAMLKSEEVERELQRDLLKTQRFGITGFPSAVLSVGDVNYLISPGYQPMEGIRKAINSAYQQAGIEFTRPESGIYS
ncbi:MAG: DsbA family protein [SAR324 cluster bacterium]|nr:DsbA family protein [SAR324 cluster bacterium]MCZ6843759.1 DsbA family protein [SAR324 cluster bacterium]